MNNTKLLNEIETAKLLGLSRQTLSNWRHERRGLNYLKLGRRVMYRMEDIESWIEQSLIKVERQGLFL